MVKFPWMVGGVEGIEEEVMTWEVERHNNEVKSGWLACINNIFVWLGGKKSVEEMRPNNGPNMCLRHVQALKRQKYLNIQNYKSAFNT